LKVLIFCLLITYFVFFQKSMFKNLVKESIQEMKKDVNIIRLTFLKSFFYSLIVILVLILNINTLIANRYEDGLYVGKVAQFFVEEISKNHFVNIVLIITISLFFLYSILYPLGQAAIIHYLHEKKWIKMALKKWCKDFFPMFEFSAISIITSPMVFFLTVFKLVIVDEKIWALTILLLLFWWLALVIINVLKSYTRYCITLEELSLWDSLKRSFYLCKTHFKNSLKFMRIQTILLINFSINLLLIVWIPLLMIYLTIKFQATHYFFVKLILYISFLFLIIISAYMSSFIRAFFAYYRYKLYKTVKDN